MLTGLASNPECSSSLQKLTLSGLQLDWEFLKEGGQVSFRSLQGIRTLILANTDLTDAGLEEVCSLPQLEYLDISSTPVTDLTALLGSRSTLRSLCAHALRQLDMPPAVLLSVLRRLRALRHLDFSDDRFASPSDDNDDGKEGDETVRLLLEGS